MKDEKEDEGEKSGEITPKMLTELIQNFEYACDFAKEKDLFDERSSIVIKEAKEKLKMKARQTSLNNFFTPE
jgi:hypothetical protein